MRTVPRKEGLAERVDDMARLRLILQFVVVASTMLLSAPAIATTSSAASVAPVARAAPQVAASQVTAPQVAHGVDLPAVSSPATLAPHPSLRWVSDCAGKHKDVAGLVGVASLLDVCGNGFSDIRATYSLSTGLTLQKILLAPSSMPLKIEAVVIAPGGASGQATGYDATGSNAPANFSERLTVSSSAINVQVTTAGPAASLGVIAELFQPGPAGARNKLQKVRLGYAPVPASAGMNFRTIPGNAVLSLTTTSPTIADVVIEDGTTAAVRRLAARFDRLPGSASLDLARVGVSNRVGYTASGAVNQVGVTLRDTAAQGLAGRATDMSVLLRTVPTAVTLDFASDGNTFIASSSAPLGRLDARLFSGTPTATLPTGQDGLELRDTASGYEVLAGFSNLKSARIAQRPAVDVQVDSTAPHAVVVDVQQGVGAGLPDQTLAALFENLAPATSLQFAENGAGARTLAYSAADSVNRVELHTNHMQSSGRAVRADIVLTGLPSSVTLDFGAETSGVIALEAGSSTIGTVFAQLTSGPDATLTGDGLKLIDTSAQYTVLARITGLKKVVVRQRPSIDLELSTTAPVLFTVDLRESQGSGPDQTTLARIGNLPSAFSMTFGETGGQRRLVYSASAAVGQIALSADNLPWSGRARRADLLLSGLPASLNLNLGTEGGPVELSTGGASIGSVEALLTSGPVETVPPGRDGVLLRDTMSQYTLAARITGLRRVTATPIPLAMSLDATAGRLFQVDLRRQAPTGGKVTYAIVAIDSLRPQTEISLDDTGGATRLSYSSSAATTSLVLDTNTGDRSRLAASLAPVPAAVRVCAAGQSNVCGNAGVPANRMSLSVVTSSATVVNLDDCKSSSCSGENLRLINLGVSTLQLNLHATETCNLFGCSLPGSSGAVWLDTDNRNLSGQVYMDTGSDRLSATFPSGFLSQNRHVDWMAFLPDASGSITCPSGTQLDLDIGPGVVLVDVAGAYLC